MLRGSIRDTKIGVSIRVHMRDAIRVTLEQKHQNELGIL